MPHLEFRRGQYHIRLERGGPRTPLGTAVRKLAEQRLHEMLDNGEDKLPVGKTFRAESERIVAALERDGMRTASERLSRLRRYVWPLIGTTPVRKIKSGQISEILAAAAATGLSQETVNHLRVDLSKVFRELVRDEILTRNPAHIDNVRVPVVAKDKRKRVLLTDEEFEQFVACEAAPLVLRTMAVVSRCFGGLRPSDIYAWQWEDIDRSTWQWADAPRPKTEHHDKEERARERILLPALVADWLHNWWTLAGCPASGDVFGKRIQNVARDLRRALLVAGVDRHELHHSTKKTLRTDFYSFRRAFVTAVAASGVNAQVGMRLAGHRSMTTHQRYHVPSALEIPASAVPDSGQDSEAAFDAALEAFPEELPETDIAAE